MKTFKKALAVVMCVVMTLTAAPLSGFVGMELTDGSGFKKIVENISAVFDSFSTKAEAAAYSGTCGDNLTWSLDTSTGVLNITGTGSMTNWSWYTAVPWYSNCSYVKTVNIASGVTTIGNYALYNCENLTSITIPDSVTNIGYYAFAYCRRLTSITIPDSVTNIVDYAFYSCDSLTSVTIPDSVTTIGNYAFRYCYSLTSITVDANNKNYSSNSDGVLFNKDKTTLIQYPAGNAKTSYAIPNSVTTIGKDAFNNCENLTSITIPDSVTTIGENAFHSCTSLTSVTIPDSVTTIGDDAFWICDSLTSVTIPDSVTSIGKYAFYGCSNLTSIAIPDNVTTIGNFALYNCSNLTNVTIGDGVTTIGREVFAGCASLMSVTIGKCVTTIGEGAFECCISLTSVEIPDSVTTIGDDAFKYCKSLTSVTIPDGVTTIGDDAFQYCESLTSVTIGNSVTTIGYGAFRDCYSLTSITIPDSVTNIGYYAFAYCRRLASITIPDSVTSIGNSAFYSCISLTSVTIPDSVTSIGNYAFRYCNSLTDVYYSGSEEQWKAISIGEYNQSLRNATIHYNYVPETDSSIIDVEISGDLPVKSGNTLTFNVTTSTGITKLRMEDSGYIVNEWTKTNAIDNGDGTLTWTVTQIINTIGENRTLDFRAGTADGYEEGVYKSPAFTCIENKQKLPSTTIEHPAMSAIFLQGDEQNLIWTVDGVPGDGVMPDYFIINVFKDNELVFAKRNIKAADYLGDDGKFFYNIDGGYFEETGEYEISVTSVKEGYQYSDDEVVVTVNQRFLPETNVIYPTSKSQIYENEVGYVHWTIGNIIPESEVHPDSFTVTVTNPSGNKTEYTKAFSDWSDGYGYDYDEGFFYFTIPGEVFATYGKYTITVTSAKEGYLPSSDNVILKVLCPHLNKTTEEKNEEYPEYFDKYGHRFYKTTRTICDNCDTVFDETKEYYGLTIHNYEYEGKLCKCGLYIKSNSVTYPDASLKKGCSGTLYWDAGKTVDNKSIISSSDPLIIISEAADYYLVEYWSDTLGAYKARFINSQYVEITTKDNPLSIEIIDKSSSFADYAELGDEAYCLCPEYIGYYSNDYFTLESFELNFVIKNISKYFLPNSNLTVTLSNGLSFNKEKKVNEKIISLTEKDQNDIFKTKIYVNNKNSTDYFDIIVSLNADNFQKPTEISHRINLIEIKRNANTFSFNFKKDRLHFTNSQNNFKTYNIITNSDMWKLINKMDSIVKTYIKSDYKYDSSKDVWISKKQFGGECWGMSAVMATNYINSARLNMQSNFNINSLYELNSPVNSNKVATLITYYHEMQKLPDIINKKFFEMNFSKKDPDVYRNYIITTLMKCGNKPIVAGIPGHAVVFLGIDNVDDDYIYICVCDPNDMCMQILSISKNSYYFTYKNEYYLLEKLQIFDTIDLIDNNNYYGYDSNIKLTEYSNCILQFLPGDLKVSNGNETLELNEKNAVYDMYGSTSNQYRKWYLSRNKFNNLFVNFDSNDKFMLNYLQGDYYYSISADSGLHIEMLDSGKMTFTPKKSGKFEMSITTSNEKTELPWYTTTVCGTSGESVSLSTKSSEGVLFEGITEGPVHAVISNDNGDTAIEFETDAEAVLVAPQTDNTVKLLVDTDNNGTYESEIPCEIVSVEGVSISNDTLEIERTETAYVYANVEPYYASNTNVSFVSSDPSIATVDENGLVTAVSCGTCTITVITDDGNFTDECKITIIPKSCTIKWVVDGTATEQYMKEGETIIKPPIPTKLGYTFTSWTPSVPETMPADNLTFTAQFELLVKELKVMNPSTNTVKYGDTLILHADFGETVLPEGYSILWTVEGAGFNMTPAADGLTCNMTSVANGNATVKATLVDENGEAVLDADGNEMSDSKQLTSKAGFWQKFVSFFKKLFGISRIILQSI